MTERGEDAGAVRVALAEKLTGDEFSCVAGKTAWLRGTVVHRHFGEMSAPATTRELHDAVVDFVVHKDEIDPLMATFAASFTAPLELTEQEFETALWRQLQDLHELDATRFGWDPAVDSDPASPRFGFSLGGHAFFVVGLHANASRITRRFRYPTMVFNSHLQFERLRERGAYTRIQSQVQAREMALQGSLNPNLADFGEASEAAQYSGRAVEDDWTCPFHPRVAADVAGEAR